MFKIDNMGNIVRDSKFGEMQGTSLELMKSVIYSLERQIEAKDSIIVRLRGVIERAGLEEYTPWNDDTYNDEEGEE